MNTALLNHLDSFPQKVIVNISALEHNYKVIANLCHSNKVSFTAVTKCVCSNHKIVEIAKKNGADCIADSRIENLQLAQKTLPTMCIRVSFPMETPQVVKCCDISLQSELATIRALADSARDQGKRHCIILMIDLGDLREGVYYQDEEKIRLLAETILTNKSLEFYGVGTNLSCYGGVLPDASNLGALVSIAKELRRYYSIELPVVSGGATSTLPLLLDGKLPEGINNLRIGEAALFGYDSSRNMHIKGLRNDAFVMASPLVEVKKKPSMPYGRRLFNAFGESAHFEDKGLMIRGICALGRQTIDLSSIWTLDNRIEILGASSDHTILNLNRASDYKVGDTIAFGIGYGSLFRYASGKYAQFDFHTGE